MLMEHVLCNFPFFMHRSASKPVEGYKEPILMRDFIAKDFRTTPR